MSNRYSFSDPRYNGLSTNDAIRQAERDNMLYEQTEALKKIARGNEVSSSGSYYYISSPSDGLLTLWCLYFLGVLIYVFMDFCNTGNIGSISIALAISIIPSFLICMLIANIIDTHHKNKSAQVKEEKSHLDNPRYITFTPEERYYIANDKAINALVNEFIEESNNTSKYDNVRDYNNKMLEIKKIIKTTKELGFMDTDK